MPRPAGPAHLLVLSAKTRPALDAMAAQPGRPPVARTRSSTSPTSRTRCRSAAAPSIIAGCSSARTSPRRFEALRQSEGGSVHSAEGTSTKRPVVFMFPGQGAQHPNMALGLYQHEPHSARKSTRARSCCDRTSDSTCATFCIRRATESEKRRGVWPRPPSPSRRSSSSSTRSPRSGSSGVYVPAGADRPQHWRVRRRVPRGRVFARRMR